MIAGGHGKKARPAFGRCCTMSTPQLPRYHTSPMPVQPTPPAAHTLCPLLPHNPCLIYTPFLHPSSPPPPQAFKALTQERVEYDAALAEVEAAAAEDQNESDSEADEPMTVDVSCPCPKGTHTLHVHL